MKIYITLSIEKEWDERALGEAEIICASTDKKKAIDCARNWVKEWKESLDARHTDYEIENLDSASVSTPFHRIITRPVISGDSAYESIYEIQVKQLEVE